MPQSKTTSKSSGKSSASKKSNSTAKTAAKSSPAAGKTASGSAPEKQAKRENGFLVQAAPYLMAVLAILIAVCVILGEGTVGGGIRDVLTGLFGGAAYVLPVFILFRTIRWGRDSEEGQNAERSTSTAVVFLLLTVLLHVLGGGEHGFTVGTHYDNGTELIGGGVFGGILGELLLRGFGKVCTLIFLFAAIVLLSLYTAGITPRAVFIYLAYQVKFAGEKRQERRAAAEEKRKNAPPTRSQVKEEEYLEYLRRKKEQERLAREVKQAELEAQRAAAQTPVPEELEPVRRKPVVIPDEEDSESESGDGGKPASGQQKKVYRVNKGKRRPLQVDIPVDGVTVDPATGEVLGEDLPGEAAPESPDTPEIPEVPEIAEEPDAPEIPEAKQAKQAEQAEQPEPPVTVTPERTRAEEAADEKLFDEVMRRTRERIEKCRRAEGIKGELRPAPAVIDVKPADKTAPADSAETAETEEPLPMDAFRKPTREEAAFGEWKEQPDDGAPYDDGNVPDDLLPADEDDSELPEEDPAEGFEVAAGGIYETYETFGTGANDEKPETDTVKLAVGSPKDEKDDISGIFANPEDAELLDKLAEAYRNPAEGHRETGSAALPSSEPQQKPVLAAKPAYQFPPIEILAEDPGTVDDGIKEELQENAVKLVDTLRSFNVKTKIVNISRGPTITRYELQPEPGTKVRSITNLVDDISLNMATGGVRIEAPIPGKAAVGVEVPNKKQSTVHLRTLIEDSRFVEAKSRLTVCLGEDVAGEAVYFDIAKMPHLLIAGATGSGKSVCINSVITSILYKASPEDVKLILIDPKKVELNIYNGIPHLLVPVVSEPKKAAGSLSWAVGEMERRYGLIEEAGVRDIKAFNEVTKNDPDYEYMPRIVIIIDELADLMMTAPDDVEESICRIAQKARAAGMHLIIGTQRPSVDVITGLIKANVPSRIAFRTSSQIDSRTIIDIGSAANLIGMGDMLFNPVGALKPNRVQGAYVSESDVEEVVSYIKNMNAAYMNADSEKIVNEIEREAQKCGAGKKGSSSASADDAGEDGDSGEDALLRQAVEIAVDSGKIATSLLQRRLSIGYGRAAKLIDRMEQLGYVSAPEGTKPRKVLITRQEFMEMRLKDEAPFDV